MLGRRVSIRLCATIASLALVTAGSRVDARHAPQTHVVTGLRGIAIAKAPPDFAYHTPGGVERLHSLVGKPVVVNFWATWCEPCQVELETFARMQAAYGSRVQLLAISDEAPGVAEARLAAEHIDAVTVDDDEHRIADLYAVSAIPVTLVLAPDGTVSHVSVGAMDWQELRDALDPLVNAALPPADLTPSGKSVTVRGNAGTPAH